MTPALTAALAALERVLAVLPAEDLPAALGELRRLELQSLPRLLATGTRGGKTRHFRSEDFRIK